MIRSTTPRQVFKVKGIDVSNLKEIQVTYSQDDTPIVVKEKDDMIIDGNTVYFTLTQEETLSFEDKPVLIQMKVLTEDNSVLASKVFRVPVFEILNEETLGE